jgi:predicted dienelactone hydrolase
MTFNVGCCATDVNDPVQGARIPIWLFYPTQMPERTECIGPYQLNLAMNAAMEGERTSLVVVSHGGGGSSLTYRNLAAHLARTGFAVALLEHPGNSRSDNSLNGTAANLENRPRHIRLAIDAAFADNTVGALLSGDRVALIGHSMGGYTSLAVAGGRPMTGPLETPPGGRPVSIPVLSDHRVRALVLLAPACGWFSSEAALANVDVPILMLTAEKDELAAHLHTDLVKHGVRNPGRVDHKVIPGAGHHAFQSPFPPAMTRPDFPSSQDPLGFDRAAFQPILYADILSFLRRVL